MKIFTVDWESMTTKDEDWSFTFIDNEYEYDKSKKKVRGARYLNTNVDLIYTNDFRELSRNEKLMVLLLLGLAEVKSGNGKKLYYDTLMRYADTDNIYALKNTLAIYQGSLKYKLVKMAY